MERFGEWDVAEKLANNQNPTPPIYNAPIVALPKYRDYIKLVCSQVPVVPLSFVTDDEMPSDVGFGHADLEDRCASCWARKLLGPQVVGLT